MPTDTRIADAEWDFTQIPEDRIMEAFIWEYSREPELEWLRILVRAEAGRVEKPSRGNTEYLLSPEASLRLLPATGVRAIKREANASVVRQKWYKPKGESKADTVQMESDRLQMIEVMFSFPSAGKCPTSWTFTNVYILFGNGVPELPFQSATNPLAILEHFDSLSFPGVQYANSRCISDSVSLGEASWHLSTLTPKEEKKRGLLSVPNGHCVTDFPYQGWRRFGVYIDFSRLDEELVLNFKDFLERARKEFSLQSTPKATRPSGDGIPTWLNRKYARDSLNALGARRLIEACGGNAAEAWRLANNRGKQTFGVSKKELKRVSKRVPEAIQKMFGAVLPDMRWIMRSIGETLKIDPKALTDLGAKVSADSQGT